MAAAAVVAVFAVEHAGREEFIGREFDAFEQLAGIVGGRRTFLFGHAEVVDRNEHLDVTSQLHHGEQSKRDQHHAAAG